MKRGLAGDNVGLSSNQHQEAQDMLYAGLDLSRQRLDVHVLDEDGRTVEVTAVRHRGSWSSGFRTLSHARRFIAHPVPRRHPTGSPAATGKAPDSV
jgi:hypothetical protein